MNPPFTNIQGGEIIIYNQKLWYGQEENDSLKIKIFPIGSFYNANFEYSPRAIHTLQNDDTLISGKELILPPQPGNGGTSVAIGNWDVNTGDPGSSVFAFGYGKYKIEFYRREFDSTSTFQWKFVNYVTLDYRDATQHNGLDSSYGNLPDIRIDYFTKDFITFRHYPHRTDSIHYFYNITDVDKDIKMWELHGTFLIPLVPGKGLMKPDASYNGIYLSYPLYANRYNQNIGQENPGEIGMNLFIDQNVSTPTVSNLLDSPTVIKILPGIKMELDTDKVFTFTEGGDNETYTEMDVESGSLLRLWKDSKIIINDKNKLILKPGAALYFGPGTEIHVSEGGFFCNRGVSTKGRGRIIFKGGSHKTCNGSILNEFSFKDSVQLILYTNAVVEIPDSSTIHLSGSTTKLIMRPNSKFLFGKNCKIIIDSSAKIIANNATFGPLDTTKTWDGIYCSNTGGDTIIGCKIINAKNGINYTDKLSNHRAIIQDCEFINKTCEGINSGIYAYNSSKILIRGNHFYSQTSCNFDNAIYLEYCTSDELNIMDNTIENSDNGIIDIGSWSYIARNTIIGDEGSEIGIYLDNYSGNIKYNKIENFDYSVFMLVSDAYLYRNILKNASSANLQLESYSISLLRPIVSGELKYWVGGDNTFDISNVGVGIILGDDSYPFIKDGYNKFYLNSAVYFITGEVPAEFHDSLEARNNYWNSSASPSKYYLTNATVKYSPTEDGSSGNRVFNMIIPMSIGFGLWDTINILDMSDNPIITDLFMLGNNKLISGDYEDAVEYFKEVVAAKDTIFTNLALKRIYYCYERSNFFGSDYTSAKNYFNAVNSDTSYSTTSRGIAKDLYLKVKFKNGEYESAVDEYNTMYENNQNNLLGLHALINKTILENIAGGDNFGGEKSSPEEIADHKKQVMQLLNPNDNSAKKGIHSKKVAVDNFKLEQNYPNPFNPTTKIIYELPISGIVIIKVYDMLGKEVSTLVNEFKQSGKYEVIFNGFNLSSGIYYYKIQSENFSEVKKMVLIK